MLRAIVICGSRLVHLTSCSQLPLVETANLHQLGACREWLNAAGAIFPFPRLYTLIEMFCKLCCFSDVHFTESEARQHAVESEGGNYGKDAVE
jgi:hypothetical protein